MKSCLLPGAFPLVQGETFKPIAHLSFPAMLPWKLEEKSAEVGYTEHKCIFLRKKKNPRRVKSKGCLITNWQKERTRLSEAYCIKPLLLLLRKWTSTLIHSYISNWYEMFYFSATFAPQSNMKELECQQNTIFFYEDESFVLDILH